MKYTCRKCGATFDLTSETKECEFCGAPIEEKNDESGNLQAVNATKAKKAEEYKRIVELYMQNGNAKDIRKEVQAYDNYSDKDIPNFKKIWRDFIIEAAGASEERKDKELQTFLKNHAREYDNNTPGSSLFLSVLQAYPKVGTNNDWDRLIQDTYLDSARFSGLCENIVNYIIKAKDKAFAMEIFNSLASKGEKGIDAGRLYIRLLLTTEDVANNVFTVSSFNGKTKIFILAIRKYCKDYLEQGSKITVEETQVWANYEEACKKQKRRNLIIVLVTLGVLLISGIATFIYLKSVNKETVSFTIDKVIETVYGEDLNLDGFTVKYKTNLGEEKTEIISIKMLKGYDPELINKEQTVYVEFSGVSYPITIVVSEAKLKAPVLTQSGNHIAWDNVLNAESYNVYVNSATTPTDVTTSLSYDLSDNPNYGELVITVRANASSTSNYKNSEMSSPITIQKLKAPSGLKYEEGTLKWDSVEGASKYELSINGTPYSSNTNSLVVEFSSEYTEVSITAISSDANVVVGVTKENIYHYVLTPISEMTYENKRISWTGDAKATQYSVYVDGEFWKDFNRNYFNTDTDGFLDKYTNDNHLIEIVSNSSEIGVEKSIQKGYLVAIGNDYQIEDNTLTWDSLGTGATYFVKVNNEEKVLSSSFLALSSINLKEGNNKIEVSAKIDGNTIICKSANILKQAKPEVSYAGGLLVSESDEKIAYKLDDGEWVSTLPLIDTISEGNHILYAKRRISAEGALEIESDINEIKFIKLQAPAITISYGVVNAIYDSEKYQLKLYYSHIASGSFVSLPDISGITQSGNYFIKAVLTGIEGKNQEFDFVIDSAYSNVVEVIKLDAPNVKYEEGDTKVTSDATNVKFYYRNEDSDVELKDGLISNLPAGIFEIYAKKIAGSEVEIDSEFTPVNQRITVFNMSITLSVNKMTSSQSQFYLVFGGCEGVDEITFSYTFDYYNKDGVKIGTKNSGANPITQAKGTVSNENIIYLANYRLDVTLEAGYEQKDIAKVKITVRIQKGTSEQVLTCDYNVQ